MEITQKSQARQRVLLVANQYFQDQKNGDLKALDISSSKLQEALNDYYEKYLDTDFEIPGLSIKLTYGEETAYVNKLREDWNETFFEENSSLNFFTFSLKHKLNFDTYIYRAICRYLCFKGDFTVDLNPSQRLILVEIAIILVLPDLFDESLRSLGLYDWRNNWGNSGLGVEMNDYIDLLKSLNNSLVPSPVKLLNTVLNNPIISDCSLRLDVNASNMRYLPKFLDQIEPKVISLQITDTPEKNEHDEFSSELREKLKKFINLRRIDILNSTAMNKNLRLSIETLGPQLTELILVGCSVEDPLLDEATFVTIATSSQLKTLRLFWLSQLPSLPLEKTSILPSLKAIQISDIAILDVKFLEKLPLKDLSRIYLKWKKICINGQQNITEGSKELLSIFAECSQLTQLWLWCMDKEGSQLLSRDFLHDIIKASPQVFFLRLESVKCNLTADDVGEMKKLTNLETLVLAVTRIDAQFSDDLIDNIFISCPELKNLHISCPNISGGGVSKESRQKYEKKLHTDYEDFPEIKF